MEFKSQNNWAIIWLFRKKQYLCTALQESNGEMAEWSIAAVLKTVELRGSGGSNPSLSAEKLSFKYDN